MNSNISLFCYILFFIVLFVFNDAIALSVNPSTAEISVGGTANVAVTSASGNLRVSSNDPSVATVFYSTGLATIKGVKAGSTTIRVRDNDSTKSIRIIISKVSQAISFGSAAAISNLAVTYPPVPSQSSVNWDGLYFGVQWGYGVGSTKWSDPLGYSNSIADVSANGYNDGLLGGVQIGYNKQYGAIVIGLETDVNAGSLVGYATCGATAGSGGSGDTCGNRTDLMASLTGRIGYAIDRSLIYIKSGGAYSRNHISVSNYNQNPIPPASNPSNSFGWTIGGGVAYAVAPNWSVNAEYGFYDFGKQSYASGTSIYAGSFNFAQVQQVAKFEINYSLDDHGAILPISTNFTGEFGTRLGYSSGRFQKRLYDSINYDQLNSILTWPDQAGLASEAFARIDHTSDLFLKGTFGGVDIGSSKMNDEDTAIVMAPDPYSNTRSSTKNGRDIYGTVDFGSTFIRNNRFNLGGFIGYGRYTQNLNAYGCEQVAGSVVCAPTGSVDSSALILSETETWNVLRLGFTGNVKLTQRLNLSTEAAWLAYASLSAKDNHWFRSDINPLIETGHGSKGYQLESTLSYALTDHCYVGTGVRYLSLEAEGSVQFPGNPSSPEKFESSRFIAFFQASYRFGEVTRSTLTKH